MCPKIWITSICLFMLIGCQSQIPAGRETINVSGKKLTVMDNPEPTAYEKTSVDALVKIDNVRGMDWLSEEEIIVDRENTDFPPEQAEGTKWYPHNLYVHSQQSGDQTPLLPENAQQGFAQVSPDRTKLFYKTFDLQSNTGKGYIMDIPTRKAIGFTKKDALDVQNGRWINNDTVIYADIRGSIYLENAQRPTPVKLLDTASPFVGNLAYLNGRLYYTTVKGALFAGLLKKRPPEILSNVVWMVPSPDEQRLAIVRRLQSGEMELLITDLQGTILKAVAQDSQIYGTAWSPDGTRLAYAGITPSGAVRAIYIADTSTGLTSSLPVDVKFISDPLHWSPAGNRLMVSATLPNDQNSRNQFVTYLVRVK